MADDGGQRSGRSTVHIGTSHRHRVHRYDRGDEEQAENGAHSIDIAHGGSDLEEPAVATRVPYSLATRASLTSMSRNFTLH